MAEILRYLYGKDYGVVNARLRFGDLAGKHGAMRVSLDKVLNLTGEKPSVARAPSAAEKCRD
jgi:hypothetical protein